MDDQSIVAARRKPRKRVVNDIASTDEWGQSNASNSAGADIDSIIRGIAASTSSPAPAVKEKQEPVVVQVRPESPPASPRPPIEPASRSSDTSVSQSKPQPQSRSQLNEDVHSGSKPQPQAQSISSNAEPEFELPPVQTLQFLTSPPIISPSPSGASIVPVIAHIGVNTEGVKVAQADVHVQSVADVEESHVQTQPVVAQDFHAQTEPTVMVGAESQTLSVKLANGDVQTETAVHVVSESQTIGSELSEACAQTSGSELLTVESQTVGTEASDVDMQTELAGSSVTASQTDREAISDTVAQTDVVHTNVIECQTLSAESVNSLMQTDVADVVASSSQTGPLDPCDIAAQTVVVPLATSECQTNGSSLADSLSQTEELAVSTIDCQTEDAVGERGALLSEVGRVPEMHANMSPLSSVELSSIDVQTEEWQPETPQVPTADALLQTTMPPSSLFDVHAQTDGTAAVMMESQTDASEPLSLSHVDTQTDISDRDGRKLDVVLQTVAPEDSLLHAHLQTEETSVRAIESQTDSVHVPVMNHSDVQTDAPEVPVSETQSVLLEPSVARLFAQSSSAQASQSQTAATESATQHHVVHSHSSSQTTWQDAPNSLQTDFSRIELTIRKLLRPAPNAAVGETDLLLALASQMSVLSEYVQHALSNQHQQASLSRKSSTITTIDDGPQSSIQGQSDGKGAMPQTPARPLPVPARVSSLDDTPATASSRSSSVSSTQDVMASLDAFDHEDEGGHLSATSLPASGAPSASVSSASTASHHRSNSYSSITNQPADLGASFDSMQATPAAAFYNPPPVGHARSLSHSRSVSAGSASSQDTPVEQPANDSTPQSTSTTNSQINANAAERAIPIPHHRTSVSSQSSGGLSSPDSSTAQTATLLSGRHLRLELDRPLERLSRAQQLADQNGVCPGCGTSVADGRLFSSKARLCDYTGLYFCRRCHLNNKAIVPWRLLHEWSIEEQPVSEVARQYLNSIWSAPLVCVSAVNPLLFDHVPALQDIRMLRLRLCQICEKHAESLTRGVMEALLGRRLYMTTDTEMFSLQDLVSLHRTPQVVLQELKDALVLATTRLD